MTAAPGADPTSAVIVAPPMGAAAITIALAAIIGARWLLAILWVDALLVGAVFGLALAALWVVAVSPDLASGAWLAGIRRQAATRHLGLAALAGLVFGLALVGVAIVGSAMGGNPAVPNFGPHTVDFLPWAAITVVVAMAEEGILRGVLFDRLRGSMGLIAAVVVTTIVFAVMHVPAYGWHVVPLDLAVGLGFAGLRLSTRTVVAPAVAHVVADIATWWL